MEYGPTSRLTGSVFDADGQPKAGVTVRLTGKGGSSLIDMVGALVGRGGRTDDEGDVHNRRRHARRLHALGASRLGERPPNRRRRTRRRT